MTFPHSPQRSIGRSRVATSQRISWVSAGTPVQPIYCSSPKERTITGSSIVPVSHVSLSIPNRVPMMPDCVRLYLSVMHREASGRRCRRPAFCPALRDARDQWLGSDRLGQCQPVHLLVADLPQSLCLPLSVSLLPFIFPLRFFRQAPGVSSQKAGRSGCSRTLKLLNACRRLSRRGCASGGIYTA